MVFGGVIYYGHRQEGVIFWEWEVRMWDEIKLGFVVKIFHHINLNQNALDGLSLLLLYFEVYELVWVQVAVDQLGLESNLFKFHFGLYKEGKGGVLLGVYFDKELIEDNNVIAFDFVLRGILNVPLGRLFQGDTVRIWEFFGIIIHGKVKLSLLQLKVQISPLVVIGQGDLENQRRVFFHWKVYSSFRVYLNRVYVVVYQKHEFCLLYGFYSNYIPILLTLLTF